MSREPRSHDPAERVLDELLQRAPRYPAPEPLKRRLRDAIEAAASAPAGVAPRAAGRARFRRGVALALAAGLVLAVGGLLVGRLARDGAGAGALAAEAVNDHLRVLARTQPLGVASGGPHQVKPWFEGRLDFAPDVPVPPPDLGLLKGGSVGYVFERKAAVLEYVLRGHAATLLVFPAEGLPWPRGRGPAAEAARDGWSVVLWRDGDLGHALVSDLPPAELAEAAVALGAGRPRSR